MDSLLEKPHLSLLSTKNAIQPGDCHQLGVIEIDDLYANAIHYAMECVLSVYLAKEQDKALKREFWDFEGGEEPTVGGRLTIKGSCRRGQGDDE